MRIFLSYASERRSEVEPIALALRERGHFVFFDRDDLPPGATYHEQIATAISRSHVVVFALTEEFVRDRRYTLSEIEITAKHWPNPNRHVLPVRLDPVPLNQIPTYLREVTILDPAGNVAAEVCVAIDGLGWQGLSRSAGRVAAGLLASCVALTGVAAALIKREFFDCWTWHGCLTDISSLGVLAASAVPLALILWGLRRLHVGYDLVARATARLLEGAPAVGAALVPAMTAGGLGYVAVTRAAGPCGIRLQEALADQDWSSADGELSRLQTLPLYPEIADTFLLYTRNAATAARYEYPPINILRQHRAQMRRLLSANQDYRGLVTLSFADNSRSIYFQEEDAAIIDEAIGLLNARLAAQPSRDFQGLLLQKLGELHLARREYAAARRAALRAAVLLPEGSARASVHANIGNTYAAQNDIVRALKHYRLAEPHYPEGQRYLFLSNFGYLYLLARNYASAETMIVRALSIKGDDWVSRLNLGLLYEEMQRPEDALLAFRIVVDSAPHDIDASREARLLYARSLEIADTPASEVIAASLRALDRSDNAAVVARIEASQDLRRALYRDLAAALSRSDTHGIERYVHWFEMRGATTIARSDSPQGTPLVEVQRR